MWRSRVTSLWGTLTGWLDRWSGDDGGTAEGDGEESPEPLEYDPGAIEKRADISAELGLRPAQFVRRIVEQEGGHVPQQELGRYWSFSPSTSCRLLQKLEDEGVIERYRIGREKIVTLAGETDPPRPAPDTPPAPDPRDGPTESRTGQ